MDRRRVGWTGRRPSRAVCWSIGSSLVVAAFLVASCFIRCPKYLKVDSRLDYQFTDSMERRIVGVAHIYEHDMWKVKVGMPIFYSYPECSFVGRIADVTPVYDPLIKMSGVKLHFEPDVKVHPLYVGGYGLPGRVRIANPRLIDCIFRPKKAKRIWN